MNKQSTRKIISFFIAVIFLVQVVLPTSVFADNKPLDYDNPNKTGDNPYRVSLKGVISSGLLTNLVGCTGIVDKVSKVTVGFAQRLLDNKKEKALAKKDAKTKNNSSVPSNDEDVALHEVDAKQEAKKSADDQSFTENCLKGIAITLAKNQLTAMTKYTMNWITTGFNGDPLYVRNVDSYMDTLTTKILQEENNIFKDANNEKYYPYGRDYARGQVNSYKASKDTYGALKQDLTAYLSPGATPESFANDFSQGGWSGWLALTQRSQNNPLGFTLKATENLENQKAKAVESAKDELNRNQGVFDQKKCVQYEVPKATGPSGPKGTDTCGIKDSQGNCLGSPSQSTVTPTQTQTPKCIKWETVTPGSVIKSKIDTYINSPERQIELADTLNDALNALFSALINKFENQGLSGLGSRVNTFTNPVSGGFGSNSLVDSLGNTLSSTGVFDDKNASQKINESFDLTRDLGNKYTNPIDSGSWNADTNTPEIKPDEGIKNQYYTVSVAGDTKLFAGTHHWKVGEKAFYDGTKWSVGVPKHIIEKKGVFQVQKNYMKSITKTVEILPKVIPKLAELDYCIPGPNDNWESNSTSVRDEYLEYLSGVGVTYVEDVYSECPFIGCDGIQFIGGLLNGGLDHSYNIISHPDSSNYKKMFDDARNLWPKIEAEEFFWIAHNDVHMTYTFSSDHWAVDPQHVAAQVEKWTKLANKAWDEYITKTKARYGLNSPMRTEFTPAGDPNSGFLPMAQAGLDMTKDLVTDAEDLPKAISDANDNFAQSSGAIYRLGFIKDKVNTIISAAQKRRKDRRVADGLPAMPQICLDNEKVTWVENDVLKQ
jgi:hypothetical protein